MENISSKVFQSFMTVTFRFCFFRGALGLGAPRKAEPPPPWPLPSSSYVVAAFVVVRRRRRRRPLAVFSRAFALGETAAASGGLGTMPGGGTAWAGSSMGTPRVAF